MRKIKAHLEHKQLSNVVGAVRPVTRGKPLEQRTQPPSFRMTVYLVLLHCTKCTTQFSVRQKEAATRTLPSQLSSLSYPKRPRRDCTWLGVHKEGLADVGLPSI